MRFVYRTSVTFYLIFGLVLPWEPAANPVNARAGCPAVCQRGSGELLKDHDALGNEAEIGGCGVSVGLLIAMHAPEVPLRERERAVDAHDSGDERAASEVESGPARGPQRIVAIGPNSAEVICALGACDRLVGVSKYCVYPPELLRRPQVGGLFDPDLERIITLRPDLIVTRGRSEAIRKLSANLGVAVYEDESDSFAGIETCVRDLGRLLDRAEEAEATVAAFRAGLDGCRQRVLGRPRPRVMVTISRRADGLRDVLTTGRGTFLTEMVEAAGGVNVFGNVDARYPQVSVESIVARRPEVIIELMPEAELSHSLALDVQRQWEVLPGIPAVKSGRVHVVTEAHALIPSPRCVDLVEVISRLVHPDAWP